ncbi:MAG TPA: ADYC domain-containing protein [Polyangia bacterium]|jgi:hypothetical protein|nr:ADYC domain-containing protein [Polyangia bacterium]
MQRTVHIVFTGLLLSLGTTQAAGEPPPPAQATYPTPAQWAVRCQTASGTRFIWPNGSPLRDMALRASRDENSEVLVRLDLGSLAPLGQTVTGAGLEKARLVSRVTAGKAPAVLPGATFRGYDGSGQPIDVAICEIASTSTDPDVVRYRLRYWNAAEQRWQNPCAGSKRVPDSWALAMDGVWDPPGAHHVTAGTFTFACETGAIAKCVELGYRPWSSANGTGAASLLQACTRMLRADYCGNGKSHTLGGVIIDLYDASGIQTRSVEKTASWDPAQARFEAGWDGEGAVCLDHMRLGEALGVLEAECPGRFVHAPLDLGGGDVCAWRRRDASPQSAVLHNRSCAAAREQRAGTQ